MQTQELDTSNPPTQIQINSSLDQPQTHPPPLQNDFTHAQVPHSSAPHKHRKLIFVPSAVPLVIEDTLNFEPPLPPYIRSSPNQTRTITLDNPQMSNQSSSHPHATIHESIFKQENLKGVRITKVSSVLQDISEISPPQTNRQGQNESATEIQFPAENASNNHLEHNAQNPVIIFPQVLELPDDRQNDNSADNPQAIHQNPQEPAPVQAQNQPGSRNTTERNIKFLARQRISMQFFFNFIIFISNILGYYFIKGDVGVDAIYAFFLCMTIIYMIITVMKQRYAIQKDLVKVLLSLANALSLIVFFTICFLASKGVDIIVAPFGFLGFLVVAGSCCKISTEPPNGARMVILIEQSIMWIQLFLIGLKVDGVNLPWGTVFVPLIFALIVLAFSSVVVIFGSLFAFAGIMREEGMSTKLFLGSVWYLLNALYTGIWLALLIMIIKYLSRQDKDEEENPTNAIENLLLIGIIHSGVLAAYTLFFWNSLCKFQEFEVRSEMLAIPAIVVAEGAAQDPQVKFQVSKDNNTRLIMVSPTFYTYFKKHVKNKPKNEQAREVQQLQSEVERVKLEQYKRGLTLELPVKSADHAPNALQKKNVNSPATIINKRGLDFSANDINVDRQLPPPENLRKEETKQTITNENQCTICFDNPPNAVLMDCGHGGICYDCALENWKKTDNCLLCRQKIEKIFKIVHIKPLNIVKVVECTTKIGEGQNSG